MEGYTAPDIGPGGQWNEDGHVPPHGRESRMSHHVKETIRKGQVFHDTQKREMHRDRKLMGAWGEGHGDPRSPG